MDDEQKKKDSLKSHMFFMLICFGILVGSIFISKFLYGYLQYRRMLAHPHLVTVSTMRVGYAMWQPKIRASGSVRAIRGVNITTELAGMVQSIYFTPGAFVKAGDVLVQLNAAAEIGTLHSLEANAALAQITYDRDKKQYAAQAISKQTLDADAENLKSLRAQVVEQTATVAKKTIRAPFTGRLGISAVNPGQYLNAGDKVVSLQMFDPIYVDFYVPQQELPRINVGQVVAITTDSFPGKIFSGKITTLDPAVDVATRNIEIEATLSNPKSELTPGMFATVDVDVGKAEKFLTLPQSAITFNPYGEVVYVVKEKKEDKDEAPKFIANQVFVVTGEARGDQITILKGIKDGDTIVTSGQLKLRNGVQVTINNTVMPSDNAAPVVSNEHVN